MSNFSTCIKEPDFEITCEQCKRTYNNRQCYEHHLNQMCQAYKKCEQCGKVFQTVKNKPHVCGEKYCQKW